MVNENDVVAAVCRHLEASGYQILQQLSIRQRGIDIIAQHPAQIGRLLIEAKGGAGAREGSRRFGKEFTPAQVSTRVARGFYTVAVMHSMYRKHGDNIALACPDTKQFKERLEPVKAILEGLRISVFLVREDHSVVTY